MYWDEKHECMPLEEMQKFQLKDLQDTVKWVYERVPFYKNKFEDVGLEPGDIKSLDDLGKLPSTVKIDLRNNYPFGLCAVPMSEVGESMPLQVPRESPSRVPIRRKTWISGPSVWRGPCLPQGFGRTISARTLMEWFIYRGLGFYQ